MKKILLTGGSGFIGRNILESHLSEKHEIQAPKSFELNLLDSLSVDEYFKGKEFDVVLHSASKLDNVSTEGIFYSNVKMFENLVRYKDNYTKFINFGSGAIYNNERNICNISETELFTNIADNPYGFSKYVISQRIHSLENFIDLNIFGIFGKYEDWTRRFISNILCRVLTGVPITVNQNRIFSYLWIDDLMPILDYFIEKNQKEKSYNIVPNENISLVDLVKIISNICDYSGTVEIIKTGLGYEYTGSNKLLRSEKEDVKFTPICNAISELHNHYKQNNPLITSNKLHNGEY